MRAAMPLCHVRARGANSLLDVVVWEGAAAAQKGAEKTPRLSGRDGRHAARSLGRRLECAKREGTKAQVRGRRCGVRLL
eukprot:355158-Chlamydomonas_euryale.AAC.2